jgi:hypothetical protein
VRGVEGGLLERDPAAAAAFVAAHGDPPWRGPGDRAAQPRVVGARVLVDVDDEQRGGLRAAQAGGAEQMQQGKVAFAGGRAQVGHPQQPRVLLGAERAGLAAGDLRAADAAHAVAAERGGKRAQRREVLGDRRRRAAGALELVAVGAHALAGERVDAGIGPDERAERAVDAGVGLARQRGALVGGDAGRAGGERVDVDDINTVTFGYYTMEPELGHARMVASAPDGTSQNCLSGTRQRGRRSRAVCGLDARGPGFSGHVRGANAEHPPQTAEKTRRERGTTLA